MEISRWIQAWKISLPSIESAEDGHNNVSIRFGRDVFGCTTNHKSVTKINI